MLGATVFAPVTLAQRREAVQVEMGLINDLQADGQLDALKKQLKGQLTVELGFIRRTCQPTPEQREQILAVAKERLDVVANANQKVQPQRRGGGFIVRNGRIQEREEPLSLRQELKKELRDILEKEQWERYQKEYDQREAFRKEVFVDEVMTSYERHLALTDQQQKEIRESLTKGWKPGGRIAFDTLRHNSQFLPQLPDELVLPFLDEDQQTVYQAAPKLNLEQQIHGGVDAVLFQEDFWELPE